MMVSNYYKYADKSKYITCTWQDSGFNHMQADYDQRILEKVELKQKKVGL